MTTTDKIMALADDYATAFGVFSETRIERRETLRTEIETLVRDVERYRWLRRRVPGGAYRIMGVVYSEGGDGVDVAIDAAMEKQS